MAMVARHMRDEAAPDEREADEVRRILGWYAPTKPPTEEADTTSRGGVTRGVGSPRHRIALTSAQLAERAAKGSVTLTTEQRDRYLASTLTERSAGRGVSPEALVDGVTVTK